MFDNYSITSGCPWPEATVKPPVWNPGPKIEIPHPENHVLKIFRFRFWKPRVWKSRPQSWDPKSWKPCPENHILKFPRFFCLATLPCPCRPALPCPVCPCTAQFLSTHRRTDGQTDVKGAWRFPKRRQLSVCASVRRGPETQNRHLDGQTDR